MKAVIYARYSSDNQREESIEGQIRECTAFAEKNGMTVLRHYIDRAYSAKTDNRPDFQEMIKDSGKKLFDMVIVWKLDRFARNRYDSARYKAQLKRNGVKVVSATEVISEGAEGIILESVLEGYAEYYSADWSEKVIRGRTENALSQFQTVEKPCHSEAGVFCLGRFYPPSQNRHDCGLFVVNGFAVLWERRFFISCNHRPRKESAMNSVFEAMGGTYRQGRSAEIADRPFSEGTFL